LFHSLTGLCGWLLALLCAMGLSGDTDKTVAARITSTGRNPAGYRLAGSWVLFTAVTAFTGATVWMGNLIYPGISSGFFIEWMMTVSYAACLSGFGLLLTAHVRADFFPALVTFGFIFAALLGGAFFDIREVLASASAARFFFPSYYYLEGVMAGGEGAAVPSAVILWAAGVVCGGLGLKTRRYPG
jgi:hypothetical protein